MSQRALVVDDDPHIRDICRLYLEEAGFTVAEAGNGQEALDLLDRWYPDVLVLDIMLPKIDGTEVLNRVRSRDQWLPVLMLTALGDESERIQGLSLGADDYLTKPFSPREMVARVQAVLRRALLVAEGKMRIPDADRRFPGLVVQVDQRQAWRDGEALTLTPREFDLLEYMVEHAGQVLRREVILERVWGFDFEGDDRTVDVHVTRLRSKLEPPGTRWRYIHTVWGTGYRFSAEEVSPHGPR